MALMWLWRDTGDAVRLADLAQSSSLYVLASLPAFVMMALLLRRGAAIPLAFAGFIVVGLVGYVAMNWTGKQLGWPV